jgi:hypothetical protein
MVNMYLTEKGILFIMRFIGKIGLKYIASKKSIYLKFAFITLITFPPKIL